MTGRISICSAANHTYVIGLVAALVSALRHAPESEGPVGVYVLDGGVRDKDWLRIERCLRRTGRNFELVRLKPDMGPFSGLPKDWGSSVMTYARLALPELVTDVARILYLDSDVIVQQPWAPLWEVDLGNSIVAACGDVVTGTIGEANLPVQELHLDPTAVYLQAGVMLINLPEWRRFRVSDRVLEYLRNYPGHAIHWDQSALNVVLYRKWWQLPDEWNTPAWWADSERNGCSLRAPLLHFVGPHKPWLWGHHTSGSAARFFEVLDQSEWAAWRPSYARQTLKLVKYWLWRICHITEWGAPGSNKNPEK